jgi:hypothetical protein
MNFAENILSVFLSASDASYREGLAWYDETNALAREIAGGDVWKGAGVIAAFSPVCPWPRNVMLARNAFATGVATGHTTMFCGMAQRIMDGEPTLSVLKGDKTRAFASAIADPSGSMIATIDRHAHDIAMGRVHSDKERKIGKRVFRVLSDAYVDVADITDHSVAQVQAITWVSWRKRLA